MANIAAHYRALVDAAKNALWSFDNSEVTWETPQAAAEDLGRTMKELRIAVRLLESE